VHVIYSNLLLDLATLFIVVVVVVVVIFNSTPADMQIQLKGCELAPLT